MNDREKLIQIEGVLTSMMLDINALHSGLNQYLRGLSAPTPTPTPAPAPTPTPAPAPVTPGKLTPDDYFDFALKWGDTRAIIEARKAPLPPGWSWEDAYASGHIVAAYAQGNSSNAGDSQHDRASLYFPAPGASAIANIAGHPGDLIVHSFAVPAGWRGVIKIGAYGQRGSDPVYGGRIDDMTFTVRDGAGKVLKSDHGSDVIFDIEVTDKTGDPGTLTAEAVIGPVGGLGYMQVNVYPR